MFLAYLHTMAVAVYLGGTVVLGAVVIPVLKRRGMDAAGRQLLVGVIRIFHPLSLAALGVLVLTGALALTSLKEMLGPQYMSRLFGVLAVKLSLVFLLLMVSSYQFFVIGLKLLRSVPSGGEEAGGVSPAEWHRLIRRLQGCSLAGGALGAVIVYLGLGMTRAG